MHLKNYASILDMLPPNTALQQVLKGPIDSFCGLWHTGHNKYGVGYRPWI